jgi:hypothetical protein
MAESKLAILGKCKNLAEELSQKTMPEDYWQKDAELHNRIVRECEARHEAIRMSVSKFHKRFTM